jgi:hypothetical protein
MLAVAASWRALRTVPLTASGAHHDLIFIASPFWIFAHAIASGFGISPRPKITR